MNNGRVAIILVNYNSCAETLACLQSLRQVSYADRSVYVVDNASEDVSELREALKEYPEVRFLALPKNGGFSAGNNAAIQKALDDGAEYILLLNNDTEVTPDFLTRLLSLAEQKPNAGIVTGKILYYSEPDRIWYAGGEVLFDRGSIIHCRYNERLLPKEDEEKEQQRQITFATGCLMLIPAEVLRKVGLLSEEYFLYSEDSDYSLRVLQAGYEIWYEPQAVIYHKVGASSKGSSFLSQYYMLRNDFYVFERYSPERERKKVIRKVIIRRLKDAARGNISLRALWKSWRDYQKQITGRTHP